MLIFSELKRIPTKFLWFMYREFMRIREDIVSEGLLEWEYLPTECNRQTDGDSCGIFTLMVSKSNGLLQRCEYIFLHIISASDAM